MDEGMDELLGVVLWVKELDERVGELLRCVMGERVG